MIDRAKRYNFQFPLEFESATGQLSGKGTTVNISGSGLLFSTAGASVQAGDKIVVRLNMEDGRGTATELTCKCTVVRAEDESTGTLAAASIERYEFAPTANFKVGHA